MSSVTAMLSSVEFENELLTVVVLPTNVVSVIVLVLEAPGGAERIPGVVILSEAKDRHLRFFKKTLQMLRFAQHDRRPFSATCSWIV